MRAHTSVFAQDHRITEVGRHLGKPSVQPPAQAGSATGSDQVFQSFIQPSLENVHCWRIHKLFGKPGPALDCPMGKRFSLFLA